MTGKTFLWIEDRKGKASYMFWKIFMQQLFPDIIVESKTNNSELVKAVKALQDNENHYIIMLDNSFDNLQVYQEQKILKEYSDMKRNILLIDIICFEYILLEFNSLIDWIYAPDDEFRLKRKSTIKARELLIQNIQSEDFNYKAIQEIIEYDNHLDNHNIEQLSAKLLFDLTRNTGFEVSKGSIGMCWVDSCCKWQERQENDICGLDGNRLSILDKMKSICVGTSLNNKFSNVGMELVM